MLSHVVVLGCDMGQTPRPRRLSAWLKAGAVVVTLYTVGVAGVLVLDGDGKAQNRPLCPDMPDETWSDVFLPVLLQNL